MRQQDQERILYSPLFIGVTGLFVACLIAANIISVKLIAVGGWFVPAGVVIFPVSYIIGDVLTEVYGYGSARRVIWLGFLCNLVVVAAIWVTGLWPAAPFWKDQGAWDTILGFAPRLLAASFAAYLVGEFANSFVLARMKIATQGRWLWSRTIGSTVVGEGLDSLVFITIAFSGLSGFDLGTAILTQWVVKVLYEIAATPLTYLVVGYLKRAEGIDVYDRETDFNPLALADPST
jgi:queuosine precursor transporter